MICSIHDLPKDDIMKIKHLWEKLNMIHYQDSTYFKDYHKNLTFEKRCQDLTETDYNHIKISILQDSEQIVGYCISIIKKNIGEIESLYIDDNYRKYGYGRKLIEIALDWFRENNCRKITVAVVHGHEAVFDFYKKIGFYPRLTYLQMKE